VVGSNIFNVFAVLGVSSAISPAGIPVARSAIEFDGPVMVAVAIACLPVFFTDFEIARWEGATFLFYYVAYVAYLVLHAGGSDALPWFRDAMAFFVIPITVLTAGLLTAKSVRRQRKRGRRAS
jgi:cation:H+ antiporter